MGGGGYTDRGELQTGENSGVGRGGYTDRENYRLGRITDWGEFRGGRKLIYRPWRITDRGEIQTRENSGMGGGGYTDRGGLQTGENYRPGRIPG